MEREIVKKISGIAKSGSGKQWFGLVLSEIFVDGTLYREYMEFVTERTWNAVEEGQTIKVAQ